MEIRANDIYANVLIRMDDGWSVAVVKIYTRQFTSSHDYLCAWMKISCVVREQCCTLIRLISGLNKADMYWYLGLSYAFNMRVSPSKFIQWRTNGFDSTWTIFDILPKHFFFLPLISTVCGVEMLMHNKGYIRKKKQNKTSPQFVNIRPNATIKFLRLMDYDMNCNTAAFGKQVNADKIFETAIHISNEQAIARLFATNICILLARLAKNEFARRSSIKTVMNDFVRTLWWRRPPMGQQWYECYWPIKIKLCINALKAYILTAKRSNTFFHTKYGASFASLSSFWYWSQLWSGGGWPNKYIEARHKRLFSTKIFLYIPYTTHTHTYIYVRIKDQHDVTTFSYIRVSQHHKPYSPHSKVVQEKIIYCLIES